MTRVSSAFTAVLISTNPLLIGVLAGPVLGERLSWRKLLGLLLGLAGVAVVLRSRLSGMQEDAHGTLLVVGGLIALVAGTLLQAPEAVRGLVDGHRHPVAGRRGRDDADRAGRR